MVRDKNGKKMSKSLGNVIDPMEVIHGCSLNGELTGWLTNSRRCMHFIVLMPSFYRHFPYLCHVNACTYLSTDLLTKIDEGNLPEKEVSEGVKASIYMPALCIMTYTIIAVNDDYDGVIVVMMMVVMMLMVMVRT